MRNLHDIPTEGDRYAAARNEFGVFLEEFARTPLQPVRGPNYYLHPQPYRAEVDGVFDFPTARPQFDRVTALEAVRLRAAEIRYNNRNLQDLALVISPQQYRDVILELTDHGRFPFAAYDRNLRIEGVRIVVE